MKKLILLFVIGWVSVLPAQEKRTLKDLNELNIKTLEKAILSENDGLSKSGIEIACKYNIPQLEKALIKRAKESDDPLTKVFLARILYKMGSTDAIKYIAELSNNDENERVRVICALLYEDHLVKESNSAIASQ